MLQVGFTALQHHAEFEVVGYGNMVTVRVPVPAKAQCEINGMRQSGPAVLPEGADALLTGVVVGEMLQAGNPA